MNRKEVEKKIEETINKVEAPDFEEVWQRIEPEIEKSHKRRFSWKKWLPMAVTACAVIICAVAIPTIIYSQKEPEEKYYSSQLVVDVVEEGTFYTALASAGIECVDFSEFYIEDYQLFVTESKIVKGGLLSNILDDEEEPTCLLTVEFFDSTVEIDTDRAEYSLTYRTESGAEIRYELTEHAEGEEEAFNYLIEASWKNVTYLIDYVAFTDNVIEFFDNFFR